MKLQNNTCYNQYDQSAWGQADAGEFFSRIWLVTCLLEHIINQADIKEDYYGEDT